MRIAYIINNLGMGGAQKMIRFVASSVDNSEDYLLIGMFKKSGLVLQAHEIEISNKPNGYFSTIRQLHSTLKQFSPDIICAFGADATIIGYLSSRFLKCKFVSSERNAPSLLPFKWKIATKIIYSLCDGIAFQLQDACDYYQLPDRVTTRIIPNAYNGKKYEDYVISIKRRHVITCASARMDRKKGIDTLLKAFAILAPKYTDYQLELYGNFDNAHELVKMIERERLMKRVSFMGPSQCLSDSIHDARVFVLPSRQEGIPNALLEAMASGVPTVSCDCPPGGPRMLTQDGKTGLLVPVDDYIKLAEGIERLIQDDNLCNELSKKGMEIQTRFEKDVIAGQWGVFFKTVLSQ